MRMSEKKENKIAIICCTNDEGYMEECIRYLNRLITPEGMEVELYTIEDANSMTSGYNEAMLASDAKYKIYIHQDTFLIYQNVLLDLILLFQQNPDVGMIGVLGAKALPADAVMWHVNRIGNVDIRDGNQSDCSQSIIESGWEELTDVVALDGMFLATQYDLPWREDLFTGWQYYALSQVHEFMNAGYRVVVPATATPWVLHDCEKADYLFEQTERETFLKEYYPEAYQNRKPRFWYPQNKDIQIMDIPWTLSQMGYEVTISEKPISLEQYDHREKDEIYEQLIQQCIDVAISHDFSPSLARACYEKGIPYIAWVFDAPLQSLYTKEAKLETNRIYTFDRCMMKQLDEIGVKSNYMPLAANVSRMRQINISEEDEKRYKHDISFVGRLYEDNPYPIMQERCEKQSLSEIEKWIENNLGQWDDRERLRGILSDGCMEDIKQKLQVDAWEKYHIENRFFYETLLARELTHRERVMILNRLAKQYQVDVYCGSGQDELQGVVWHGTCEYHRVTPKVFRLSKINLNMTLRSIESGVPQRIFDIMAAGGFVITNAQPEIKELFEVGKEIIVYHNPEELEQFVEYYLHNEKERLQIARNGYRKVCEKYDYRICLEQMIQEIDGKMNDISR